MEMSGLGLSNYGDERVSENTCIVLPFSPPPYLPPPSPLPLTSQSLPLLPVPYPHQVEQTSRPDLVLFMIKYLMLLVVGIPSVFWVGSKKTCFEWASFLQGRRRKE